MAIQEQDTFIRTAVPPGGWGTATNGSVWSIPQGTLSCFSTNGTQAVATLTGGRSHTRIGSTSDTNQVVSCDITPSNASSDEFGVNARQSGTVGTGISLYRLTYNPSSGGLVLFKAVAGTATQLDGTVVKSVSNLTKYSFKLSCTGTLIQGKMWLAGTSEPAGWDITVTDSSIASGAPGCTGNSFDSTGIRYENFVATDGTIQKDIVVRGRISQQVQKDITVRGRISQQVKKDIAVRGRISQQVDKDITVRGKISGPRIASGGFALFVNGTGTAQFDSFRVTQYPDPALSLAPVLPRVGATLNAWNDIVPTGTSVGVDISTDGVTWTDVSANNGSALHGIFSQPDAIVDGFDTDTSANYTNTFRTGGSIAIQTHDTANSRLAITGGVNAIYVYGGISRADVDFFITMDRSDAGGLVWRYIDANNFYYLAVGDSLASVGTPNTFTLYKVASNVQTQLSTSSIAFTRGTYPNIRVTMLAGLITIYFDGTALITVTDGSPLGAGKIGLFNNGGTVGSRYYQLWMTPQGDYVSGTPAGDITTGKFVYTRQRLASTDPTQTPRILDLTVAALSPDIGIGALMPAPDYRDVQTNKVFDDLKSASKDWYWFVRPDRGLVARTRQADPAPWVLVGNDTMIVSGPTVANNGDHYRNRQIVTNVDAGDGTTTTVTRNNTGQFPGTISQAAFAILTGGGTGIVTNVVDGTGMTVAQAQIMADGLLQTFGVIGRTITFETQRQGLKSGQYLSSIIPEMLLNDASLLITSVQLRYWTGVSNVMQFAVEACEGPNVGSWAKLISTALK